MGVVIQQTAYGVLGGKMIIWDKNKFKIQRVNDCTNYNWTTDKNKRCAILHSESIVKPKNAYIEYKCCSLDFGNKCEHYNCGVQLC